MFHFNIGPKAKFPRKFQYVPKVKPFRPLIVTEIRRPDPEAVLVVQPDGFFELTEAQYKMLFMRDQGPMYQPGIFVDCGPVEPELPKGEVEGLVEVIPEEPKKKGK